MPRFVKKPVEIEAVQWDGGAKAASPIIDWVLTGAGTARYISDGDGERIVIDDPTNEGAHDAKPGDYVICGLSGEFYGCKPDIFEATYEPAAQNQEGDRA